MTDNILKLKITKIMIDKFLLHVSVFDGRSKITAPTQNIKFLNVQSPTRT